MKQTLTLTPNAKIVFQERYLKKNAKGKIIETPLDLFHRVAKAIAKADQQYNSKANLKKIEHSFFNMMSQLEFLPNSPTLMNAGKPNGQLAACFVLPIGDSILSIFETLKLTAIIQKSGGGTGFNFSKLRPQGSRIHENLGESSGPLSFMEAFNAVTDAIKQGGARRGANMAILNIDHPDILKFIHAKEKEHALTNFNISVAVTDKFMTAVQKNKSYELKHPKTQKSVQKLSARKIFNEICKAAWTTGDPGLIFIDEINRYNPTPSLGPIESTNPCGEQPLLPFEACTLGSLNLNKFLTSHRKINWKKLEKTVRTAVHFLDNVVDANTYPFPAIQSITHGNRKIGLGVMGLADILLKLNIPYASKKALAFSDQLMKFMDEKAHQASRDLAKTRGPFPNFKRSLYAKKKMPPLRNATVTTLAPTGTLSLLAGCSSGIEPVFSKSYVRHVLEGKSLAESYPNTVATAHEISYSWHIRMQSVFQKYSDSAVSKTINLPNQATLEDIQQAYLLAYRLNCKGITVFRDGCKGAQVYEASSSENCPECHHAFTHQEACTFCQNCGYIQCA
ncbi:MAG: adenosylcobalamin-dependent ribonucleoside-diphosphate reductase [Deltaproteobacteria bacterium]|nr:adenosylcobalamin-dependent ribonucleoside-diphosphate reductase [Deltaproteobacteria bacterium]